MIRRVICAASAYLPASSSEVAVYGGSSAWDRVHAGRWSWRAELSHRVGGPAPGVGHPGGIAEHRLTAHLLGGELGVHY